MKIFSSPPDFFRHDGGRYTLRRIFPTSYSGLILRVFGGLEESDYSGPVSGSFCQSGDPDFRLEWKRCPRLRKSHLLLFVFAIRALKNDGFSRFPIGHAGPMLANRLKFSDWLLLEGTSQISLNRRFCYFTPHSFVICPCIDLR